MATSKLTARIVGILFITGTVAGVLSIFFTGSASGSFFDGHDYLAKIAAHETQVTLGSLLVLVMAFSLAMIPVVLFPIFRKYNEALALGAVLFRGALEAFAYMAVALSWLALVALSQEPAAAGTQALGEVIKEVENWSTHLVAIVFSLGALMIYWLFYVSKLIPRWLAVWGLAGAVLYLAAPLLAMFGHEGFGGLMAPLAIQEMILAFWLIIKGFNPSPAHSAG